MVKLAIPRRAIQRHRRTYHEALNACLRAMARDAGKGSVLRAYCLFLGRENRKHSLTISSPRTLWRVIEEEKKFWSRRTASDRALQDNVYASMLNLFDYGKFKSGHVMVPTPDGTNPFSWRPSADGWRFSEFQDMLGITECPYCNADSIERIEVGGRGFGPDIEHYFPQSEFPYLALSLFNLIPACNKCNGRIKKAIVPPFPKCTHPYRDSFHEGAHFTYQHDVAPGNEIVIRDVRLQPVAGELGLRAEAMANLMLLNARYGQHYVNEVKHAIRVKRRRSASRLDRLKRRLPGLTLREMDIADFEFELLPKNINCNRFSKLYLDIVYPNGRRI